MRYIREKDYNILMWVTVGILEIFTIILSVSTLGVQSESKIFWVIAIVAGIIPVVITLTLFNSYYMKFGILSLLINLIILSIPLIHVFKSDGSEYFTVPLTIIITQLFSLFIVEILSMVIGLDENIFTQIKTSDKNLIKLMNKNKSVLRETNLEYFLLNGYSLTEGEFIQVKTMAEYGSKLLPNDEDSMFNWKRQVNSFLNKSEIRQDTIKSEQNAIDLSIYKNINDDIMGEMNQVLDNINN